MATRMSGFFRSRPRLAKAAVLGLLAVVLAVSAFLGLQVHIPGGSGQETLSEWAAFLVALAACAGVLRLGGHLLNRSKADPDS